MERYKVRKPKERPRKKDQTTRVGKDWSRSMKETNEEVKKKDVVKVIKPLG
jgi:hypothetical protein